MFADKIHLPHLLKHKTKRKALIKFLLVFLVFALYFAYVSFKFGVDKGFVVTALTWSFFVLCTPVADAGFLLDFPIRLITRLKMFVSEILVWAVAIALNIYFFFFASSFYEKTELLKIFYKILSNPLPYWSIIGLSAFGTFLSIYFADELVDKAEHHELSFYKSKKHIYATVATLALFAFIFFAYYELLQGLDIKLINI